MSRLFRAAIVLALLLACSSGGLRADNDSKIFDALMGDRDACSSSAPDLPIPSNAEATGGDRIGFPACADPSVAIEAKSGCCSHHGGVCGCDSNTGHQLCCDGKDSPSCGC